MAYIRRRNKGWSFTVDLGIDPATGKRKQLTKSGFPTKKEAQRAVAQIEMQLEQNTYQPDRRFSFKEVYEEWWSIHSQTIKESTQAFVQSKVNRHILPRFGHLKIREISPTYCQRMINEIATEIKSVSDIKVQANQIFKYALKMDYIAKNPMQHTVIPKRDEGELVTKMDEKNFWNKHEVIHFLSTAKEELDMRNYLMFYLLIYTGIRKGELAALEWKDIDLEKRTMYINKTMFFKNKKEVIQTAKKKASIRSIRIDENTAALLRKWKLQQSEWLLERGINPETKYVLTRADGRPLRLAHPNDKLNSLIDKHNLSPITVHGFRHTHASLLFEAGATIKEVQERLGHRDIQTTMNVYAHVTDASKGKTADLFAQFMDQ
ncbi:site-specific integrase [Salimicrobium jeotgali]|uniref:Site-specific integrase n=1 Tax=Salimicrobium jeotgali TaxID=1230341 RepID=K2H3J7_9BACI|nr:site-specific integrase [Salimicrobium jeotgali]AKG05560.1 site-specific integrase [Salimicrobium jeotgali]EKE30445.1 hypothetical protein MJ3_13429 [Salimicrobium jeotgali]MBM7696588.1 integrase [Salimicrobium jeotgali]